MTAKPSLTAAQGYQDAVAILTAVAQLRDSNGEDVTAYRMLANDITDRVRLASAASGLANFLLDTVRALDLDRDVLLDRFGRYAADQMERAQS